MRQNIIQFMMYPTLLILLAGCVKRDLETRTEGYAEIALDWGGDTLPKSARFLFYNESGKMVREATGITDSFKGALAAGTYRLVVHNENAAQVDYRGVESYSTAEVFAQTTDYTLGTSPAANMPCILEPQLVFGTGVCKEFKQIVIERRKTTLATVCPVLMTRKVQILFVVNGSIGGVLSLKGVLSGVAPSAFFSTGESNTSIASAVEFTALPRSKAVVLELVAEIGIFNLVTTPESTLGTNVIRLILLENNGARYEASTDLTEILKKIIAENGGVLPVEIPVKIEITVKPGGVTLTASADPWDDSGSGSGSPRFVTQGTETTKQKIILKH